MKRLVDGKVTMPLEEYAKVVNILALVNTDQAVMDIRLHSSVIEDTLRERIPNSAMRHTARRDLHLKCLGAHG
jgi:hypothetical protein